MKYKKLGSFVTQVYDNGILLHTSRSLRKQLSKPSRISWWIAFLFMVGSSLFASASFLLLASLSTSDFINSTFFIGSLFFTAAAYLQYLEVINRDITVQAHINSSTQFWVWVKFRVYNLGFLASFTQFIGTLFFNVNTFEALLNFNVLDESNLFVWTPNLLGSLLFLLSSFFAYLEIYHDKLKAFRSVTWWIIWINIFGSLFFGISALYSYNYAGGDNVFFDAISEWTTLLGAICFFIAAYLLRFEKSATPHY